MLERTKLTLYFVKNGVFSVVGGRSKSRKQNNSAPVSSASATTLYNGMSRSDESNATRQQVFGLGTGAVIGNLKPSIELEL